MTESRLLSDDLLRQIEETARAQNRKPSDVLEEAVKQYLERESWVNFVERNEARAKSMGLTEDDVPRLVEEVRREKHRERGH
jgi:predicted transcriptional regulator